MHMMVCDLPDINDEQSSNLSYLFLKNTLGLDFLVSTCKLKKGKIEGATCINRTFTIMCLSMAKYTLYLSIDAFIFMQICHVKP